MTDTDAKCPPGSVTRHPLGLHPLYYRTDGAQQADTLDELLRATPALPLRPDIEGISGTMHGDPDERRTCVDGISQVPAGHRLLRTGQGFRTEPGPPLPEPRGSLGEALVLAIEAILEREGSIAMALSGGLDSALVLAIIRRELGRSIPVFTLAIDIPGYGERAATRRIAATLGVKLHEIPASTDDYRAQLPAAIRAAEVPMWNPHPVSKLLLAQALRREGIAAVITGDAADQIFSGAPRRSYLPLVGRLFRCQGIEPCSPFFDPQVLAHAARLTTDLHKRVLRDVATQWLPAQATVIPKARRLAPDLGVERLVEPGAMEALATRLGLPPPRVDRERERCAYATLCMLWSWLEREVVVPQ